MTFKQGDSVTNSKCPDWGTGVVFSIGSNSAQVRFPEVGPKRLRMDVLVPSADRAPVYNKKGRKADPEYQTKLKELTGAISDIGDREGIQDIESMIYEAFLVSGVGKGLIKRQLGHWLKGSGHATHSGGYADVKALYDFLFPVNPERKRTSEEGSEPTQERPHPPPS